MQKGKGITFTIPHTHLTDTTPTDPHYPCQEDGRQLKVGWGRGANIDKDNWIWQIGESRLPIDDIVALNIEPEDVPRETLLVADDGAVDPSLAGARGRGRGRGGGRGRGRDGYHHERGGPPGQDGGRGYSPGFQQPSDGGRGRWRGGVHAVNNPTTNSNSNPNNNAQLDGGEWGGSNNYDNDNNDYNNNNNGSELQHMISSHRPPETNSAGAHDSDGN
jgi:hypothetical protein